MKKNSFCILALLMISILSFGQNDKIALPDLETAEPDFFDPTRTSDQKEEYKFSTEWRIETGYVQLNNRTQDTTSLFLHGIRLGSTIDFVLPYHFTLQSGVLLSFSYGLNNQHWPSMDDENAQVNILKHNIMQLQLAIPIRAYYNITLWKKLRMFFFAGPQLQIGLISHDIIENKMSQATTLWLEQQGIPTNDYDRYAAHELYRTNIQFGLGGGFEWDRYRLQAGYDFGLNNILRTSVLPKQKLNEWGWLCTFSYQL